MKPKHISILRKIIFMLFIMMGPVGLSAPYNAENDIIMQKVTFENQLKSKFTEAIGSILEKNEFVVNVNIVLDDKTQQNNVPVFGQKPGATDMLFIDKFDLSAPVEFSENEGNIRDRINAVKVEILLDKSVRSVNLRMVKSLVQKINTPLLNVEPEVSFTSMALVPPAKPKKKERETTLLDEIIKWLMDLKTPIGMILASFLLSAIAVFVLVRLLSFGNKFLFTLKEVFNPEVEEAFEDVEEEISVEREEDLDLGELVLTGYNRFRVLLEENPDEALLLIRRWLNVQREGTSEALTIIVRQSPTKMLLSLFEHTTDEERREWKKLLKPLLSLKMLREGDAFIESQIMDDQFLPPPMLDTESKKILSEMTPEELAAVILTDMEIGAILVNVLPVGLILKTYQYLDSEKTLQLADYGLRFTETLLEEKKTRLKAVLLECHTYVEHRAAPFLEKITELIPIVEPEKEKALWDSLFNNNQLDVLKETAMKVFPSALMVKLPKEVLKSSFVRYPTKLKIEFLLSKEEEVRNFWLDTLGDETSKVRELLDVDLTVALGDEFLMSKYKKNKDKIWNDFIQFMRIHLKQDVNAKDEMERVIDEWITEKTEYGDEPQNADAIPGEDEEGQAPPPDAVAEEGGEEESEGEEKAA